MSHPSTTYDKADKHDPSYTEGGMYKPRKGYRDRDLQKSKMKKGQAIKKALNKAK